MPVVLDNDPGERVLLYGTDGVSLLKVLTDSSGRLVVVVNSTTGAVTVTATNLDIRDLVKAQDELYAVLRDDAGSAYDARRIQGIDGSTQRQLAVDASGRPRVSEPRERTPLKITGHYNAAGIAPHGDTVRWSYTVPAGKKARVEHLFGLAFRDGLAPGVSITAAYIQITPSGGSTVILFRAIISGVAVGELHTLSEATNILMLAGDLIEGSTVDTAGGGTARYGVGMIASEFDA